MNDIKTSYFEDPRNWDGADIERDIPKLYTERNLKRIRTLLGNPKSRIWKCEEQLHQDEFEDRSPFCTCYSAMSTYGHWFGEHLPKGARESFVNFCLDNKVVFNGDRSKGEKRGGNTVKTAVVFTHWFNQLGNSYEAVPVVVRIGSWTHKMALNQGHAVSTSFKITEDFRIDRRDNLILDGQVHGGKVYNGHAVLETKYTMKDILVYNSYKGRRENHFGISGWEYINKYWDTDYHREYGVIVTFKKR